MSVIRSWNTVGGALLCLAALSVPVAATPVVITSMVGGAPTGVHYVNFDDLPLGNTGGTSGGITVSFIPDGQAVQGAASGLYAAPFLSNNNGALFGDSSNVADTSIYLTTGVGAVSLLMPNPETYFGLLWGSVDLYNTLEFYNGSTLIGRLTGADVTANANGDQGAAGTYYVNVETEVPFDRVVASSSQYAFEFDNVAYNTEPIPEPASLPLFAFGLMAWLAVRKHRHGPVLAV